MTEIFVITSNDLASIETSSSSHSLKQRNHNSANQNKSVSDVTEIYPISIVDECHDKKEGKVDSNAIKSYNQTSKIIQSPDKKKRNTVENYIHALLIFWKQVLRQILLSR